MPIIPWRPFWELEGWFEERFPEFFEEDFFKFPKIRTPRVDIYEKDDKIVAEIEIPGVKPEDINVEVGDNFLKIEAKSKEEREEKEKGYYKKEIGTRYFKRVVSLPTEVKGEEANAEYEDGILKVEIPKLKKKEEAKKIKVKIKKKESK
jgi:HSP20 family protein